ncbi:hypothetical protein F5Y13DRAFT_191183 [Hypoxylon sp. FL1857]|nr:hypothetical protein F5Y13DRAFT_191183 [Hypoxylon sp. FL1857]
MAAASCFRVPLEAERLLSFLSRNAGVRFIRLQWLDYTNMLRCRVVTRNYAEQLAEKPCMVESNFLTLIENEEYLWEHGYDPTEAVGQSPLIPDWDSLRLCPWAPGHASVQCYFGKDDSRPEQQGHELHLVDQMCPRAALQRAIIQAGDAGTFINIGFEIRFRVTQIGNEGSVDAIRDSSSAGFASSMNILEKCMLTVMDEVVTCLDSTDIPILGYHAGSQSDQYIITTECMRPMTAADMLVFTRQVIRNVCKSHSLVPTFDPHAPWANGVHINISVSDPDTLHAGLEESFLAGMLEHLRAMFAFSLPLPKSYGVVVASRRLCGQFEAWGSHNREVPIQKTGGNSWQLRCADASANIYLMLAAIIVSGASGLKEQKRLTVKDCQVDPETLSPEDRKQLGITRELPSTLKKAHSSLRKDRVLNDSLGSVLVEKYLQVMTDSATIAQGDEINDEHLDFLNIRL